MVIFGYTCPQEDFHMRTALLLMLGVAIGFLLGAAAFELINHDSMAATREAESRAAAASAEVSRQAAAAAKAQAESEHTLKLAEASHDLVADGWERAMKYWKLRATAAENALKLTDPEFYDEYISKVPRYEMRVNKDKVDAVIDAVDDR